MAFNSLTFVIFLMVVLAGYYALTHKAQNVWLLAASWVFYAWWDPRVLGLLILSSGVDYLCGLRLYGSSDPRGRKLYLTLSICTNLVILGFFKYLNFFIQSANEILQTMGLSNSQPALNILLPVGISFYTFRTLSYTMDVYRGKLQPCTDFVTYALYVGFFPQLLAGPIERASSLLPQLGNRRMVSWEDLREGGVLILIGLFKKVGVADALAPLTAVRFQNPAQCSGADLLFALYLFSVQIYCDFSGYSDIARGIGKLFGIETMVNFNRPYFSSSVTEFWRRWHISLSSWLRDYVYISFGGNRKGPLKTYRNLMLTMLLCGLWHGANVTYVVWGGLHGLYLSMHKFWVNRTSTTGRGASSSADDLLSITKIVATFHLVAFSWILFHADNLSAAWQYFSGILTWQKAGLIMPLNWHGISVLILLATLFTLELIQDRAGDDATLLRWHWVPRGLSYGVLIVVLLAFGGVGAAVPFFYFQF